MRSTHAGETGTSTRRFPGAECARVRRRAIRDAVCAAEKLAAALSWPSSGGLVKTGTARAIPQHATGRTWIEVRGEAQGVPPVCGV
ncbi:hypothetical protein NDU88_000955 [Pleurodeles waltl]|uniref:Uncharacterized protein n=1 Tax=Pleurodeles waltl TaxID=8319 RepID=A0AAV7P2D6_PLEWA|nr:hypothetical protein NDU88_000955 [Pleurodeles waltl]